MVHLSTALSKYYNEKLKYKGKIPNGQLPCPHGVLYFQ